MPDADGIAPDAAVATHLAGLEPLAAVDWRAGRGGYTMPPREQGTVGTWVTFVAAAALESSIRIPRRNSREPRLGFGLICNQTEWVRASGAHGR